MLTQQTSMSKSILANLAEVHALRSQVGEFTKQKGLPHKATEDIELAISEICTNIVEHGYQGSETSDQISIEVLIQPDNATVTVTDTAPKFELPEHINEMPNKPQVRGYGLRLVIELTDQFSLENTSNGNIWTLQFSY